MKYKTRWKHNSSPSGDLHKWQRHRTWQRIQSGFNALPLHSPDTASSLSSKSPAHFGSLPLDTERLYATAYSVLSTFAPFGTHCTTTATLVRTLRGFTSMSRGFAWATRRIKTWIWLSMVEMSVALKTTISTWFVISVLSGIKLIWHQLLLVGRTVNPGKAAAKHQQETCSPVMVLWRWQSHHLQILSPI